MLKSEIKSGAERTAFKCEDCGWFCENIEGKRIVYDKATRFARLRELMALPCQPCVCELCAGDLNRSATQLTAEAQSAMPPSDR